MTCRAVIAGASQIHTYQPKCDGNFMNIHLAAQARTVYTFQLSVSVFKKTKQKKKNSIRNLRLEFRK